MIINYLLRTRTSIMNNPTWDKVNIRTMQSDPEVQVRPKTSRPLRKDDDEEDEITVDTNAPVYNPPQLVQKPVQQEPDVDAISKLNPAKKIFESLQSLLFANSTPEEAIRYKSELKDLEAQQANMTNEIVERPQEVLNNLEPLSPYAVAANSLMYVTIASIDATTARLNMDLEKSSKLATFWKEHLAKYEKFISEIKSRKKFTFKILAIGGFGVMTLSFLWYCYKAQKIPEFVSQAIGGITSLMPTSTPVPKDLPSTKPSFTDSYNILQEHPMASGIVVGTVASVLLSAKVIMVAIKVIRFIRKVK
jgi:hypothetical protein